jgi:hypothetical protein
LVVPPALVGSGGIARFQGEPVGWPVRAVPKLGHSAASIIRGQLLRMLLYSATKLGRDDPGLKGEHSIILEHLFDEC